MSSGEPLLPQVTVLSQMARLRGPISASWSSFLSCVESTLVSASTGMSLFMASMGYQPRLLEVQEEEVTVSSAQTNPTLPNCLATGSGCPLRLLPTAEEHQHLLISQARGPGCPLKISRPGGIIQFGSANLFWCVHHSMCLC